MVKKIPKDHRGLYICPPFSGGIQTYFNEEDTHNGVGGDTTLKPRAKCFTTQTKKMNEKEWEAEHQKVLDKYRGTTEFTKMYIASLRRKPK